MILTKKQAIVLLNLATTSLREIENQASDPCVHPSWTPQGRMQQDAKEMRLNIESMLGITLEALQVIATTTTREIESKEGEAWIRMPT